MHMYMFVSCVRASVRHHKLCTHVRCLLFMLFMLFMQLARSTLDNP